MDLNLALKLYVTKMIEDSKEGMKLLLMDKMTTAIISMIFTQTEMLQREIFLFEHINTAHREPMKHMKAICFLQPTPDNIIHLENELRSPKYESYYIYFSNSVSDSSVQLLAQADESELVHEIKEFYMDYLALTPHLYSVNCPNSSLPSRVWEPECFTPSRSGLISVLLSLKKSPAIRFQAGSDQCERLARDVANVVKKDESFHFRQKEALPLLLILDRRDDPITPLLNQWTYQAMVHEILGINKNRVDLSNFSDVPKDLHEIVMSSDQDEFYRENMYCSYGEIGLNIKHLVDQYQTKFKSQAKVETIAEMKAFVESYPQFRKLSGTVSKHVAVMGELSKIVKQCSLMEISELEQEICANSEHSKHLALVKQMLSRSSTSEIDGLRLALLYALKYERQGSKELQPIIELLTHNSTSPDKARRLVSAITEYGGFERRSSDLFGTASPLSFTKKLLKGLKDVENIYTQHTPLLATTLENALKGKLRDSQFPVVTPQSVERPQDIIVFIVGGVTYEEALAVANLNKSNQGAVRIVLGGTCVHNCKSFLKEVLQSTYSGGGAKKGAMKRDIP